MYLQETSTYEVLGLRACLVDLDLEQSSDVTDY